MPAGGFDVDQVMGMLDALQASGVVTEDDVEALRARVGEEYNKDFTPAEKQQMRSAARGGQTVTVRGPRDFMVTDDATGASVREIGSGDSRTDYARQLHRVRQDRRNRPQPNDHGHYTPHGPIESVNPRGGPIVRALRPVESHVGPGGLESLPGGAVVAPLRTHAPNPMAGSPALDFAVQRALARIASQ